MEVNGGSSVDHAIDIANNPALPMAAMSSSNNAQQSSDQSPSTLRSRSSTAPTPPNKVLAQTPSKTKRYPSGKFQSQFSKTDNNVNKSASIWKIFVCLELSLLVCILALLIASFTVPRLKYTTIWDLRIWRWCVLLSVTLCGNLMAYYVVKALECLIWMFWLDAKVLYFVCGVQKSLQAFIWLGLICLAWSFLFDYGVERTKDTRKTLNRTTKGLVGCLLGVAIWLVKTLCIKLVASFHASKIFDKIEEAISRRNAILALSEEAISRRNADQKSNEVELGGEKAKCGKECCKSMFELFFKTPRTNSHPCKMSSIDQPKYTTMKELIDGIRSRKLKSLTYKIWENGKVEEREITNEQEAEDAARHIIFKNLALKDDEKYMDMEILEKRVEDKNVRQHFEEVVEERDKKRLIKRSLFRKWVVRVYNDHDSLNQTLKYSKYAIDELNMLASTVVLFIIVVVWLLFMGLLTTKAFLVISSQLVLAAFMFGNSAKNVFEAIVFVFIMHPFDIGDRCIIDGVQMVVDEMNILNTIFLKFDGEKVYYPNSVLAVKPIGNLYRSPPMMDVLQFAIALSTSKQTIENLQKRIKAYLEENRRRWRPAFSLQCREIEDVNKMKLALYVNHTINFQYFDKRAKRRSDLVLHMKKIFEDLGIEYHLLPQKVHFADPSALHLSRARSW